jgi:membrane-associated protease RseP (regulator of RpoE activity)
MEDLAEVPIGIDMILDPHIVTLSFIYALVLLGILLGHELGHFLTCRYYKIDATLPFFIPAPTLIGTLGAFIKIRSPITRKKQLFDIGVAGPLAGFILAVPTLVLGLSLSKTVAPISREGSIFLGEPLLLKLVGAVVFKGASPDSDLVFHPIAFAGWVGILVTALNLFPIGQLDGGHVFYALLGQKSRQYSRYILAAFVLMGIFFWIGWLVWAVLISVLGLKHPQIVDEDTPLSPGRKFIGFLVIVIFILSFIPDPIKGFNLIDFIKQFFI